MIVSYVSFSILPLVIYRQELFRVIPDSKPLKYPNTFPPQQPLLLIICTGSSPHHSLCGAKGGSSVCNQSLLWITGSNLVIWKQVAIPNSSYIGFSSSSPSSASKRACRAALIPSVGVGPPSASPPYPELGSTRPGQTNYSELLIAQTNSALQQDK